MKESDLEAGAEFLQVTMKFQSTEPESKNGLHELTSTFGFLMISVEHGTEPAAGEEIEADGGDSEERVKLHGEGERERGEGDHGEECDGEDVSGALV